MTRDRARRQTKATDDSTNGLKAMFKISYMRRSVRATFMTTTHSSLLNVSSHLSKDTDGTNTRTASQGTLKCKELRLVS